MTWCANELVTDEAIVAGWNDPGLPSLISLHMGCIQRNHYGSLL